MTQDEIIEMARKVGMEPTWDTLTCYEGFVEKFEAFAKLVAAKEREACAKLMETMRPDLGKSNPYADAIRARGNK